MITLTLYRELVIRDFTLDHVNIFNKNLTQLKTQFQIFDFFFIYNNVKIYLDAFLRQYPLELETTWTILNTPVLTAYSIPTSNSHAQYRNTQRFYKTVNNLDPIYFLPFNWQTAELVFSTAVKSPTTFSDNNQYQAFSIGYNLFSFVNENTDVVYSNPTYAFIDNERANKKIILAGNTCQLTLPLDNNQVIPFTILIIYADAKLTDVYLETKKFGPSTSTLKFQQVYNNQNYLATPDGQIPLTFYLPYPFYSNWSSPATLTFETSGVTIFQCFLAETPVVGNSAIITALNTFEIENFLNDVINRDDLSNGYWNTVDITLDAESQTIFREAVRRISDTYVYYKICAPAIPTQYARYRETFSQTDITQPYVQTNNQGMFTWFNFAINNLQNNDYVALPTIFPFVNYLLCLGGEYLGSAVHYVNLISDFKFNRTTDWLTTGLADAAIPYRETMTTASVLWPSGFFSPDTDDCNDYTTVSNLLPPLLYRNQNQINFKFIMSGLDSLEHGLRTSVININHYIAMRIPSVMTLNFFNNKVESEINVDFTLGGVNPVLLSSLKYLYCRVTDNKKDTYEMNTENILTGRVETNMIQMTNVNQNKLEPVAYFNGVSSISTWRPLITLTSSAKFYYKIVLDSKVIENSANLNVTFCLA